MAREASAEWAEVGQCRTVTPSALPGLTWWRYFLGEQEDLGSTCGSWGTQSPVFSAALDARLCCNVQCGDYQTDSGRGKPCPMALKGPHWVCARQVYRASLGYRTSFFTMQQTSFSPKGGLFPFIPTFCHAMNGLLLTLSWQSSPLLCALANISEILMLSSLDVLDEITQPGYDLLWLQASILMGVLPLWDLSALLCGMKKGGHPLETAFCSSFPYHLQQNCCPSTMVKMSCGCRGGKICLLAMKPDLLWL